MKKTTLLLAAAAMMSMMVSCSSSNTTEKAEAAENVEEVAAPVAPVTTDGVVMLADDAMFRPDSKVDAVTILDFNATWCVPCKKLTPAFEIAAEQFSGKVNFYSVDIEKNPETAKAFNVQNVPTVVFLAPDGTVQTYVGLDPFGINKDVPADQTTQVILENISGKINELLK